MRAKEAKVKVRRARMPIKQLAGRDRNRFYSNASFGEQPGKVYRGNEIT